MFISGADHYGWIDEKHDRTLPAEYDTSRGMASVKWGPNKNGKDHLCSPLAPVTHSQI